MTTLTAERAKELLEYDPSNGWLTWKVNNRTCRRGHRAGCEHKTKHYSYRSIGLDNRHYKEHRVIWLMTHGEWPSCHIDHIDHDATNNRLENLRLAPANQSDNQTHQRRRTDNTSGVTGVTRHLGKWQAQITLNGKAKYLGRFESKEDAARAYAIAKRTYHPFAADYQEVAA